MKFPVYCVRDSLLGYGIPVLRDNDAVASRAFEYDMKVEGNPMSSHPEHYQLFRIGEFDTDNAHIESIAPELICNGSDFVKE